MRIYNLQSSKTPSGVQISTNTLGRELHGVGLHGQTAAGKAYITKHHAKRRVEWCKSRPPQDWRAVEMCLME